MKMEDKVVLVTGAALGYKSGGPSIGSTIALKLAEEGASVVVVDIREKMGKLTAERIKLRGGSSSFVKVDVSQTNDVKKAIEITKREFGKLHCLVNCAASYEVDITKNVKDIEEKAWNQTIDINLNGYFRFAKYGIPLILESGGGTIINISSGAAFRVLKNYCVYPVTKAAINALTRSLAIDFAPQIRTNTICPGFVRIENSEGDRNEKEITEWITNIGRTYPLQRTCSTEEIANVALFLACKDSSCINGECITVDGGRSISDSFEF
jgi:NAD(P)-dependent dehydrogenase (short-subunit alcohol dehydrogenase family)